MAHPNDNESSVAESDAGSEPSSPILRTQHSLGNLRSPHHRATPSGGASTMNSHNAAVLSKDATGPSIQQSVRMFKLFETLRSGDKDAITKAVTENSTMPTISEGAESGSPAGTLEGTSILHLAIQCADTAVVEQIIAVSKNTPGASTDVNVRDRDGNTPLHLASQLGRPTTVRLLLEQQDINDSILNYQGRSALDLARTPEIHQQLQLSRSLFLHSSVKEVQTLAAKQDYEQLEKTLVDPRVEQVLDVNSTELATDPGTLQSGGTLLHEAARKKDIKLIQLLLMHGADPFKRDGKGKLPQDVTKDDKTRGILKKSPAATAAKRGIQEKAVLGSGDATDGAPGGKDSRELKGYLKKWTNYTSGYKLRWFVLEDGVLSYYKHQGASPNIKPYMAVADFMQTDDAGSACRGAINMRIAKLYMDPQDKTRFEIQGKSSVKYHLKANHVVEAKRWFWALNNAIQWTKDEAKSTEQQKQRKDELLQQAKAGNLPGVLESSAADKARSTSKGLTPATAVGVPLTKSSSRVSFQESFMTGPASVTGDENGSQYGDSYEPSIVDHDLAKSVRDTQTAAIAGDLDDEEEYGDDANDHELQPASKDAFYITANSANLQLNLLSQVSSALQAESSKDQAISISDPIVKQALSTYDSAMASLQGLIGDLVKISRDRDAYWQYRLDREADVRKLWEDSMAKVAKEQEVLEGRIGESEEKRKRTKRALKEALESTTEPDITDTGLSKDEWQPFDGVRREETNLSQKKIKGIRERGRRRSTIADLTNLSDSDSDEDEEFFDAVDAGEIEVVEEMPTLVNTPPPTAPRAEEHEKTIDDLRDKKKVEILPSFEGYDDPIRKRLKMDADNRPKISLWVCC